MLYKMDVVKREMSKLNVVKTSVFQWTPGKAAAAMMLAEGYTFKAVAKEIGKTERTLFRWNNDIEFSAEVDRLTKATCIKQMSHCKSPKTERDALSTEYAPYFL